MPGFTELVLVVEPNGFAADRMAEVISAAGCQVCIVGTGHDAVERCIIERPSVVTLELGLPDTDGVDLCKRLRQVSRASIVVVTADAAEERKILALDAGADDYVTKPFSMPELLARLRVAFRHWQDHLTHADTILDVGELRIDMTRRLVTIAGRKINLTPKEFDFLVLLGRHADEVLTHRVILQTLWGAAATQHTEYVRVIVNHLRKKLRYYPASPKLITEPWVGYRLVP